MTISNQNQQNDKELEDAILKIHGSCDGTKRTLGIISSSDMRSQRFLQNGNYSKIINVDLKEERDVDSAQFGKSLEGEKFDLIYIGNLLHYTKHSINILNNLSLHLSENGILAGYLHNGSHLSVRISLLDGDFDFKKIGLGEDVLHYYTMDGMLMLFDSSDYSLNNLHKIKDKIDIKRADLFHYKFPPELFESILSDPESGTIYYVFETMPKSKINKLTRAWANQFSRNLVTEKLNSIIESYKKVISEKSSIIEYYQRVIKDKQIDIQEAEKQEIESHSDKSEESHLLQVLEQKEILTKGLMESIGQKDAYIERLTKSMKEKDLHLEDMTRSMKEKDMSVDEQVKKAGDLAARIKELEAILLERSNELVKIHNSFTWRFFRKLDKIGRK